MKDFRAVLLDLDGTLYRGSQGIAQAPLFVSNLRSAGIPFAFVTNNSTLPPEAVAAKLTSLGVAAHKDEVITTSMATANYIYEQNPAAYVYVIGEEGLLEALQERKLQVLHSQTEALPNRVDYVVVGLQRNFDYEMMKIASLYLQKGAQLIGTNPDLRLPSDDGLIPGSGTLCRAVALASGVEPLFIGKPEPLLLKLAAEQLGASGQEVLVIGDNLETDIQGAVKLGYSSALVLTGYSTALDVQTTEWQPTIVASDLTRLFQWMET